MHAVIDQTNVKNTEKILVSCKGEKIK